jgi:hypothetical protein
MTAGIAPFLFMQLLPKMLNPNLYTGAINYSPIVLTGILVGVITTIIFAKTFEDKEPREIFFYALGIPAVLIATVSNISTETSALRKIDDASTQATIQVLNPVPEPAVITDKLKEGKEPVVLTPPNQLSKRNSLMVNTAWASEVNWKKLDLIAAAPGNYLIVIGEYNNPEDAWRFYDRYRKTSLRSERYIPKRLQVLQLNENYYVLIYSRHTTQEQATRAYKVLQINDPGLDARIMKY